jgi:hypothetical protein
MQKFEYLFFACPVTHIFLKSLSKQLKQYYKNLIFDIKEKKFRFLTKKNISLVLNQGIFLLI